MDGDGAGRDGGRHGRASARAERARRPAVLHPGRLRGSPALARCQLLQGRDEPPCPLLDWREAPSPAAPRTLAASPDSTAYILYTSGTTGQPKGVRVSHRAFETHCRSAIAAYGLRADDRALVFAPLHFDASWEQLFAPLVAGASVLIRDAELWAPEEWCRQVAQGRVTCADIRRSTCANCSSCCRSGRSAHRAACG